jgi:hypothetical protein
VEVQTVLVDPDTQEEVITERDAYGRHRLAIEFARAETEMAFWSDPASVTTYAAAKRREWAEKQKLLVKIRDLFDVEK